MIRPTHRREPTLVEIRRVTEAMLPQDTQLLHGPVEFRGWTVRVYRSPFGPDCLLVCAERPAKGDGPAPALSEEVADMDEARAWMRRLTPEGGLLPRAVAA